MSDDDEYPSYNVIVEKWGYDVAHFETFGSYQGDHVAVLRDGDRWGWVVIGYGSCSGCDALEAIVPWDGPYWNDEVQALSDSLRDAIHWDSSEGLVAWLTDEYLQEGHWYWHEDGYKEFVQRIVAQLTEA